MMMETEGSNANNRDKIVRAYRDGSFLQTVYDLTLADREDRDTLSAELAEMHNDGVIDLVAGFSTLGATDDGPDFFLTRHVFEKALPTVNAPVVPLMSCVLELCSRAGQDMAAGMIVNSFVEFCEKDSSRPAEALSAIKDDLRLLDLLTATIVAGARLDARITQTKRLGSPGMRTSRFVGAAYTLSGVSHGPMTFHYAASRSAMHEGLQKEQERISAALMGP